MGIELCQVTMALHELVDGLTLAVEEGSPARHDWGRESRLKSTPLYIRRVCMYYKSRLPYYINSNWNLD